MEQPKIDSVQEITSIKRIDSIACFTKLVVILSVKRGINKILALISLRGRLAAKNLGSAGLSRY